MTLISAAARPSLQNKNEGNLKNEKVKKKTPFMQADFAVECYILLVQRFLKI